MLQRGEATFPMCLLMTRIDGTYFHAEVEAMPLQFGGFLRYFVVIRDIAEMLAAQGA